MEWWFSHSPTHHHEDVESSLNPASPQPNADEGAWADHRLEDHSPVAHLLETVVRSHIWVALHKDTYTMMVPAKD